MNRGLVVDVVRRLPQAAVSRAWGWVARRRHPKLAVGALKHVFVRVAGIDLREADARIGDFATLEELFVRRLRPGARRIDPTPGVVVSPVDAALGARGTVHEGTLFQVKGRQYSLARLLDDDTMAARFEGGDYVTLYLAPHDYHRIHAPLAGTVRQATHVPGALLPVFPEALEKVDELFARNERWITYLEHESGGVVAVVKVGATLVGRISVTYDRDVHTNDGSRATRRRSYEPPVSFGRGDELGAFELGSTVVLVASPGLLSFELGGATKVRMGERMGRIVGGASAPSSTPKGKTRRASKPRASRGPRKP